MIVRCDGCATKTHKILRQIHEFSAAKLRDLAAERALFFAPNTTPTPAIPATTPCEFREAQSADARALRAGIAENRQQIPALSTQIFARLRRRTSDCSAPNTRTTQSRTAATPCTSRCYVNRFVTRNDRAFRPLRNKNAQNSATNSRIFCRKIARS